MKKIKVMSVFGTRPEAIKMAPLVLEMEKKSEHFESIVVVTAQHRQMLDQVLEVFDIDPKYDLNLMEAGQTLADITSNVLSKLDEIVKIESPDILLSHGDTTTAYAASLSAFYNQVKVGHVEAGLRTWNKHSPYPEEINRQMIDLITDVYLCPTNEAKENLLNENKDEKSIFVTGNTVIDALKKTVTSDYDHPILSKLGKKFILLTMHRRENIGEPMENVFQAVKEIVEEYPDVQVVYPVHLNPKVQQSAKKVFAEANRVHLIEPLDVVDFHNIAARSHIIMSDSGGIQEEAPSLNVPVLVLRDTTERPEGVSAGTLKLVGTEFDDVKDSLKQLLDDEDLYEAMSTSLNPYGDGHASERILEALTYSLTNKLISKPKDFQL